MRWRVCDAKHNQSGDGELCMRFDCIAIWMIELRRTLRLRIWPVRCACVCVRKIVQMLHASENPTCTDYPRYRAVASTVTRRGWCCVTKANSVHLIHSRPPECRERTKAYQSGEPNPRGKNVDCAPHTTQSTRALSASRLSVVSLRCSCATLGYTFIYVHTGHNLSSLASCSPTLQATGPGATFRTLSTQ